MNKQEEDTIKYAIKSLEGSIYYLERIHPDLITTKDYNKLEGAREKLFELNLHLEHGVALLPVKDLPVLTHPDRQVPVVHHQEEDSMKESTEIEEPEVFSKFYVAVPFSEETPSPYITVFYVTKTGENRLGFCNSKKVFMTAGNETKYLMDECDHWLKRM
jgi:hypothetical protein